MASFDERNKETARALVELLTHADISFAVLDAETCCGDPARRTGNEYLAQALIEANAEQFREGGVRKVVTACPHCFNTLKHEYRQFGVEFFEVLHHGTLLARLLTAGKLTPRHEQARRRIVFHDSCYLGRYNSIYYQPRDVVRSVRGVQLAEPAINRDKGYCCGAGGGMMFMEETEGQRVNHWRYGQLKAGGPAGIAVACPFCMVMLDDAAKDLDGEGALPVEDIAVTLRRAVLG
jgi:Fe-S oxidoreductase